MLNGSNTEIVFEGTLFHIQTTARKEANIETPVYVKGFVVLSVRTLYLDFIHASGGSDQEFTRVLEEQHRQVSERIRAGKIKPPLGPFPDLDAPEE